MATRKRYLLPAALVGSAVLCTMIWLGIEARNDILRNGREIVLQTEPVDPRDLLRGRYVRLGYSLTMVKVDDCRPDADEPPLWRQNGRKVYALVTEGSDGRFVFDRLELAKPADGLFIAGRVDGGFDDGASDKACQLRVEYGIERFYAAEAVAPEIERRMRDRQITDIVVALSDDGVAQIKALRQGETVIFTESLY